jgi:co-chaperonin GroES (HSP10)
MRDEPDDFRNNFSDAVPAGLDMPRLFRMVIMPLKAPIKSAGGILIPEATQEGNRWNQQLGRVAGVGPFVGKNRNYKDIGYDPEEDNLKVGDLCMFSANNPQRYTFEGANFVIVNDDAIMIGPIKEENISKYKFGRIASVDMSGVF